MARFVPLMLLVPVAAYADGAGNVFELFEAVFYLVVAGFAMVLGLALFVGWTVYAHRQQVRSRD